MRKLNLGSLKKGNWLASLPNYQISLRFKHFDAN